MRSLHVEEVLSEFPKVDRGLVQRMLTNELKHSPHKIVVLDDDPTGIQTVHGVSVYTNWSEESMRAGFRENNSIFFFLTNSRGFTRNETANVQTDIAKRVQKISEEESVPYILISRGDSTLRGHYPLETETLKQTIESISPTRFDGEVFMPFFKEGGRLTVGNVHYVRDGDQLIPVGETEFAKDRTFDFNSSHLGDWIEEKTNGEFTKEEVIYISLDDLREVNVNRIKDQLMSASNFQKIIVNALDYSDVEVFAIAFMQTLQEGRNFLCRTAAALTKVLGGVPDKALLTSDELITYNNGNGGLIVIGSHVKKTTEQLRYLLDSGLVIGIEFDVRLVLDDERFKKEIERVRTACENEIITGQSVAFYTSRERFDLGEDRQEDELKLSIKISNAVTRIVRDLNIRPNYIVAKGGITSSSIGTTALSVERADVAGQIKPGIPVWKTKEESKFPGIAYIIFPGNVGQPETLKEVVDVLEGD